MKPIFLSTVLLYKIVHFCMAGVYNLDMQKCTFLHDKSVHSFSC